MERARDAVSGQARQSKLVKRRENQTFLYTYAVEHCVILLCGSIVNGAAAA